MGPEPEKKEVPAIATAKSGSDQEQLVMPRFGQKINIRQIYRRRSDDYKVKFGTWKFWDRMDRPIKDCIFLGTRTLKNGVRECWHDEGCYFKPHEYIQAAYVSPGPRAKPVYVPLDAIEA